MYSDRFWKSEVWSLFCKIIGLEFSIVYSINFGKELLGMVSYDNVSIVMFIVIVSNLTKVFEEGGLVFVVLFCLCVFLWVIYIIFYYFRLMGIIFIRLIRLKYIEDG